MLLPRAEEEDNDGPAALLPLGIILFFSVIRCEVLLLGRVLATTGCKPPALLVTPVPAVDVDDDVPLSVEVDSGEGVTVRVNFDFALSPLWDDSESCLVRLKLEGFIVSRQERERKRKKLRNQRKRKKKE